MSIVPHESCTVTILNGNIIIAWHSSQHISAVN